MRELTYLLTSKLVAEGDKRFEVINYGIDALFTTTVTTLVAALIALLGNYLGEFITFGLVFIPIRCSYKSFHCSSFLHCLISSNLLIFISCNIFRYIDWQSYLIIVTLIINTMVLLASRKRDIKLYMLINVVFGITIYIHKYLALAIVVAICANSVLIFMDYLKRNNHMKIVFDYL